MLQIRTIERQRRLVRPEHVDALIDEPAGVVLTHLSGMGARCTRDLALLRRQDVFVLLGAMCCMVLSDMAAPCSRDMAVRRAASD